MEEKLRKVREALQTREETEAKTLLSSRKPSLKSLALLDGRNHKIVQEAVMRYSQMGVIDRINLL